MCVANALLHTVANFLVKQPQNVRPEKWECQLPKLDVAGSNPVSRSIFSISYRDFDFLLKPSNGVQRSLPSCKLLILNSPVVKNASLPRWHSPNVGNSLNFQT